MKIAVLVKEVPDTWEDRVIDTTTKRVVRSADVVIDEIDEKAVEAALLVAEANAGSTVTVVTMGPAQAVDTIRKALAMGADSGIHILDDALVGSDAVQTSLTIAAALSPHGFDLVIAGNESTDGRTGALSAMLAERLNYAQVTFVRTLHVHGAVVSGERITSGGHVEVSALLPAVVSVTEQIAEARFPNFKGIRAARKKPVSTVTIADLGIAPHEVGGDNAWSVVQSVQKKPARTTGTIITDDGTGARQLADYLAAAKLI
ncbi:electron transfer flavoprotein subunit beta/FixA family protein [Subtercola endophyticus]|nr:electron transfer flavoprotein subunit beta/FixA family protein [Subtercola endophyticus]